MSAATNSSQRAETNAPGATMPHLTTTTTSAAAVAMEGVRPTEVETDQVLADDASAGRPPSPPRPTTTTTARTTGTKKGGPRGPRTRNAGTTTGAAKPAAAAKPTPGRRKKLFDSPRAQAAYERVQDLKQSFGAVQKALKGPLNEIADRSISTLLEDPAAIERAPEYGDAQAFLASRFEDQQRLVNSRRETELAMARHVLDGEREAITRSTNDQIADLCHEAYGQLLDQLEVLEKLVDAGLPLDLPALPEEVSDYLYKEISQEDADTQGPFIETIDGAYIPVSGRPLSELMTKKEELTMPATPKRRAENQPEDQPAPKMAATAKDGDGAPKMARHPAGLLAAVEALEDRASEAPPSNAPSPRAEPLDAPSPGNVDQARASGVTTPRDPLEIPVPRGASSADEHGVRLISRKATQMNIPNNRIMVPMPFLFDDHEIGFRDSTNSLQKGATKARRGRHIDKPNSNYLFIDRRVGTWDSTNPDDEFDEALIKKHRLHPTLGIVLPTSVNDWEPPKPVVTGWKPVVLVSPDGKEIHASRTIPVARLDRKLQDVERRAVWRKNIHDFCQDRGIPEDEIALDQGTLEEYRREMLMARGMDPDQELPSEIPQEQTRELTAEDLAGFNGFIEETLQAASIIAAREEEEEEAERIAASKEVQQAPPSRPYDAIRDVFMSSSAVVPPIQPAGLTAGQDPAGVADTVNLSYLADVAEQEVYYTSQPAGPTPQRMAPAAVPEHLCAIDPSLFGQGSPDGPAAKPSTFDPADNIRTAEYPSREVPAPMAGFIQHNDSDFHRPTIYPPPNYQPPAAPVQDYPPPIGGAAHEYSGIPPPTGAPTQEYSGVPPAESPSQDPLSGASRTPFSNTAAAAKGLPALRPVRSLLSDSSPPPESQDGSVLQHPNMVVTNSGTFFPPAPNRPFHTGFLVQEQFHPMQSGMPPQPIAGPIQGATMQGPPSGPPAPQQRQASPYLGSPPDYHSVPVPAAHPPLAPAPAPPNGMTGPSAPMPIPAATSSPAPQHGPAPLLPASLPQLSNPGLATTPTPRSRPGSSSASSAKYRKLEPAPTPPHRMGYAGAGQELRTVQFDYREQIKDYPAMEAPPRHGPTHIRGWTHNNQSNIKKSRPSSKGDAAGTDEPS